MKRALIYSCILHILLFLLSILTQYFSAERIAEEPVSVIIVPLTERLPRLITPSETIPKTLGRLPPIRDTKPPKYLSAIPKGEQSYEKVEKQHEDLKKNEQRESTSTESLKSLKEFSKAYQKQNPDIFDRDVIAKLSKKTEKPQEFPISQGLTFSAKEFNDWGYLERLKEKIERVWHYPPQAAMRGIYGDLYIRFTIDKKGKLLSMELLRTSGYRMLDDAAMQALKDAQPFWPLPDEWQQDSLTVTGHFIYTLRGFYLR